MNDRTYSTLPSRRGRRASLALAAALTLGTAACGSNGPGGATGAGHGGHDASASSPTSARASSAATGPHNDADVAFATGMVPHHGQALTMSDLALQRSSNADVKALATAIKGAQGPEIRTMSGWLAGWGHPVPVATGGHSGHDMSGMNGMNGTGNPTSGSMDGMMTADQMASLEAASGPAFDRLWLELMVEHHEGAVSMARTELRDGASAEAKALAQAVVDGQTAEIATMRGLLARLGD